ncbi:lipopolysaccharide biosynthesis protein [Bradyrhizobium genosp. P]|uniref:lipopolysaccharide biosynthesis protein n=1 Tax=Bradyrhizobium genosp. P TaxID=83641 RepID=UPI003CF08FE4
MDIAEPASIEFDRAGLKAASRKAIVISYLSQAAKFVIQFLYTITMARLLTPADFGVVGMAAPLLAFATLLADVGLSQAAIQNQNLSNQQLSFLFWMNLGVTTILASVIVVSAPLVASFYHEPRVAPVVAILGALMIIGPLGSQHSVLLNRNFAFGKLAAVELTSLVTGTIAGVAAALGGLGIWSIILNQATGAVVALLMLWLGVRWRPSALKRGVISDVRHLLHFGANVATFNIFNFLARNIDAVLIGRAWGEVQLGIYTRAYSLLLLPLNQIMVPISKVALPLLSRIQNEPGPYRIAFWKMLDLALLLVFPVSLFSLVAHQQLINIVLGQKWEAAGPIFGILSIGALFAPISHSANWLLLSQGRGRELRQYGMISSIGFTIAIVAGLPGGPLGVASAYIGFGVVQGPILWSLITKTGPVNTKSLFLGLLPYLFASLPVVLLLYALQSVMPPKIWSLLFMLVLSYGVFAAILALTPHGRNRLLDLVAEARHLVSGMRVARG